MEAKLNGTKSQIQKEFESSNQHIRLGFENSNGRILNISSQIQVIIIFINFKNVNKTNKRE